MRFLKQIVELVDSNANMNFRVKRVGQSDTD